MAGKKNNNRISSKSITIIVAIVAVIILASSMVTFLSLRNLSTQVREYNKDLSGITEYVKQYNEDLDSRVSRLSSAELLMNNANLILSTVYFGTADKDELEEAKDFTAFSLMYKDEYYVITAGHCIEMDGEKYKNFKFKANNEDYFITLELLDYKSDYSDNNDYAIFYDPRIIRTGLYPAGQDEDQTPQYVLGNIEKDLNLVKRYSDAKEGESGSPVLNSKCHVVGIMIKKGGAFTPISVVLEALDRINPVP